MKATAYIIVCLLAATFVEAASGPRRLNNFTSEFTLPSASVLKSGSVVTFRLDREQWVWLSAAGVFTNGGRIAFSLNSRYAAGRGLSLDFQAPSKEVMWYLPAGEHSMAVEISGSPRFDAIRLRTVPEMAYERFPATPANAKFGVFDRAFLGRHVFPNINTLISGSGVGDNSEILRWAGQGGRWFVETPLPTLLPQPDGRTNLTAVEILDQFSASPGMRFPEADGLFADEYFDETPNLPGWSFVVTNLLSQIEHTGKEYRPFVAGLVVSPELHQFMRTCIDAGSKVALERYLGEPEDSDDPTAYLNSVLRADFARLSSQVPGLASNCVMALGHMSIPPHIMDRNPAVDFKVWLDMQMRTLANGPEYDRLAGVLFYTSKYSDEEYVRWTSRLFRHYGIEGQTNLLSATLGYDLRPGFLRNPDFEEGSLHWRFVGAVPGSMNIRFDDRLGWFGGRYPRSNMGRRFVWLRQDATGTNQLSQLLTHLIPGRAYSLRFVSASHSDWVSGVSINRLTPVTAGLEGAVILPEFSYQAAAPTGSPPGNDGKGFTKSNPAFINMHRVVFRATAPRVLLTLRDTPSTTPEEWLVSCVQVQPYELP